MHNCMPKQHYVVPRIGNNPIAYADIRILCIYVVV